MVIFENNYIQTRKPLVMKFTAIYIYFLLVAGQFSIIAQTSINSENYYEFYKDYNDYKGLKLQGLSTYHLSELEIVKILHQEMKNAGFEWIANYRIIRLKDENYITSICFSEKSNFGFVLETTFDAIPESHSRSIKSLSKERYGYDYCEKIIDADGKSSLVKIVELPSNLIIIKQDNYWYQTTEDIEVKNLVTKDIIISILRTDVQKALKRKAD
jgi:hypothetical protein